MRRLHFVLALACVLVGMVIFLLVRSLVLSTFRPVEPPVFAPPQEQMSPQHSEQYRQAQSAIILAEQHLALQCLRRSQAWVYIWPVALSLLLVGGVVGGGVLLHKKTRPVVVIASASEDGRQMTTTIPILPETVLERQLVAFAPVARNLALANGEAQEQAMKLCQTWQKFAGQGRGGSPALVGSLGDTEQAALPVATLTPTFHQLIQQGVIAPGQPLVAGYHDGAPEYRTLENLKAMAIAGWQGSGKTFSSAYLMGSVIYAYGAEGYLLDPHRRHKESLTARVQPLIDAGYIHSINPFQAKTVLTSLDARLDRRLNGQEPCTPAIIIMFDELSRIVKAADDMLSLLIGFLERCTEETRKANMIFCGCSPKWTARHFGGRADIRGCLNSSLVHKMKPSQAKLLLEDPEEVQLLKELNRPGEGVLVTDFSGPVKVTVPYCQDADFTMLAERITAQRRDRQGDSEIPQTQVLTPVTMLDGDTIQGMIKSLVSDTSNGLRLKDIYAQMFTPDELTFETFRTKYYRPQERVWQDTELTRLSERLPALVG